MSETISVEKAIAKGHRMVNYPVQAIMFATIGLSIYIGIQINMQVWIIPTGFFLAFGLGWLYWSFMITKWRLWAFENVRNVHELKNRAVQELLIWPDHSVFEKTEIRSLADQQKWDSLQEKFDKDDILDDIFIDDLTIPNETIIYYSDGSSFIEIFYVLFMVTALIIGLSLLIKKNYILGSILSVVGASFAYKKYTNATNTEPQIIINDQGIKTSATHFYKWNTIQNETVIIEMVGDSFRYYLIYDHPIGTEILEISDFDIAPESLEKLLSIYRHRSLISKT